MTIKDVTGFPPYKVSDTGKVWGFGGKQLNPKPDDRGYIRIYPKGKSKGVRVHQWVALMFLGERPHGANEVNHKDGNKQNNAVSNLEWTDRTGNMQHAYLTGLSPKIGRGTDCPRAILTDEQVMFIREKCVNRHPIFSQSALGVMFGVSVSCINRIIKNKNWSHL